MMPILDSACQQGFLYGIAVLGIVMTLRVLNWPDLTVDGSFTLGAAVLAVLLQAGHSPLVAMIAAAMAGFVAGTCTYLLNRKLGISRILSGILVMLILYSVNLRIMGRANISLLRVSTVFTPFDFSPIGDPVRLFTLLGVASIFTLGICYFLATRLGLFVRAAGDNEFMVQSLGVNTGPLFLIGLGLSNSLVAISGSLVAQNQGFADIGMGTGIIITGIAALIIGESAISLAHKLTMNKRTAIKRDVIPLRRLHLLPWQTFAEVIAAILGAVLYFFIIAMCLRVGLQPTDLRLATGFLVIAGIAFRLKGPSIETYMRGRL